MLLVFFLVTSSMESDKGLRRQLPPPPQEEQQAVDILEEDIMTVALDAQGTLTIGADTLNSQQLRQRIVEFAAVAPKRRVVALNIAADATYDDYYHLQEDVVAAYRRLKVAPRVSETVEERGERREERGESIGEREPTVGGQREGERRNEE
jgi:biopolymer transport protein ExbD